MHWSPLAQPNWPLSQRTSPTPADVASATTVVRPAQATRQHHVHHSQLAQHHTTATQRQCPCCQSTGQYDEHGVGRQL